MLLTFIHRLLTRARLTQWLVLTGLLLLTSCHAVGLIDNQSSGLPLLSLDVVEPAGQLGTYVISGQAQLPDQTPVTVSATRTLQTSEAHGGTPFYAILDRQRAVVEKRRWSAQLQLLQTEPGGGEQWQVEAAHSGATWQPQAEVDFTVTIDPALQTAALQQRLEQDSSDFETGVVRISDEGERYAIATQTITLDPPIWTAPGQTSPPIETRTADQPQTLDRPTPINTPPLPPEALL